MERIPPRSATILYSWQKYLDGILVACTNIFAGLTLNCLILVFVCEAERMQLRHKPVGLCWRLSRKGWTKRHTKAFSSAWCSTSSMQYTEMCSGRKTASIFCNGKQTHHNTLKAGKYVNAACGRKKIGLWFRDFGWIKLFIILVLLSFTLGGGKC